MNSKANLNKLGVKKSHRDSLKKNLLSDLIIYEHMKTTRAKSKVTAQLFDKAVNIAKKDLPKNEIERKLTIMLSNATAVSKLMDVLAIRFKDSVSGFVNTFTLQPRKGDGAQQVQMIVKGYVYKEVGKKVAKAAKDEKASEKSETKNVKTNAADAHGKSQIAGNVSKQKVKTRSGI